MSHHHPQSIVVHAAAEPTEPPSLNEAAANLAEGAVVEINGPTTLTADLELPSGVTLVFGPVGRICGAGRLVGHDTRISASADQTIFGADVALDGEWDAEFSPRWFGAVYDGTTDCTAAIQKCLDQRGTVRLRGRGTALISDSLIIHGDTWLCLAPYFTIRLADGVSRSMLRTRWADQRYFENKFPDFVTNPEFPRYVSDDDCPENWVLGEPETNIRITGGIWDANGGTNPRLAHLWGSYAFRGMLMVIVNVKGFVMRDVSLYDPTTYFFDACALSDFTIDNIHLDMRELRLNQDGIHLEGECFNGVISNIHGRTWDDMVALNGGDGAYPKYPSGFPVPERGTGTNVIWRSFRQGHIRNIMIRDIHVSEGLIGYRAVRLLSTGKYKMDNITIDGIHGRYTLDGVLISAHLEDSAPYGSIIVRNVDCEVVGEPETAERGRRGLFWLENEKVKIDTLIIDGCRFRRTSKNGQFLYAQGSIKRLFVSNVDVSVEEGAPMFGRGAFSCVGDKAVIEQAYVSNLAINAEGATPYDVAFQGNWRELNMNNARIKADTPFDVAEHPDAEIKECNVNTG